MSRANYAGLRIRQQHWRAIGRHDSEQEAWLVGDQGVGLWPLGVWRGGRDDYCRSRMDLVNAGDRCAGQNCVSGHSAIGLDQLRIVAAAKSRN